MTEALQFIIGLIVRIANQAASNLFAVADAITTNQSFLLESFTGDIDDATIALIANADQQTGTILDAITQGSLDALLNADNNSNRIIDIIGAIIGAEAQRSNDATATIINPISDQIFDIDLTLGGLESQLTSQLGSISGVLGGIADVLAGGLNTTINNRIVLGASVFEAIIGQVAGVLTSANAANAGLLTNLGGIFKGIIGELLDVFLQVQRLKDPELVAIAEAILHNKDKNTEVAETQTDRTEKGFGGTTIQSIIEQVAPQLEISGDELRKSLGEFAGGAPAFECFDEFDTERIFGEKNVNALSLKIIDIAIEVFSYIFLPLAITSQRVQALMFSWNRCNPNQPLPIAESLLSLHRDILSSSSALENIQAQGFTREDAERIVQVGQTIPDITFIYNMFYRDLIDESGFDFSLKALGFADGFIEPLKELAFFIPPVQDIITMAVREVFSPEIAQAQGQFEDLPEDFVKFAKQQGVSREWAERYWAAHWALPSVQMGYEMMHRGVISQKRLKDLLRALDVMPFWRQPLIDISFRPFTRVDIRRMHRVGVLTDEEVNDAYKDLGYGANKARKLTDFVLAINKEDEILTLDVASDLTTSSILNFYKDGIIGKTIATALLIQAGINLAAAELMIIGADLDIERRARKQSLDIILDKFRFGGLNFTEAADQITALGFETKERELALLDLEAIAIRFTKLPSKADLDKFLKAKLLTEDEYIIELGRLGFPFVWAEKFLALNQGAG